MTDNEIIKALECCVRKGNCKQMGCPMIEECKLDLRSAEKYALSLINRQKAELETLRQHEERWHTLIE